MFFGFWKCYLYVTLQANKSELMKRIYIKESKLHSLLTGLTQSPLYEAISSVVYHFTSPKLAYSIVKNNAYYLQSVASDENETYGTKMFYMSTTRNRNTNMSYASNYGAEYGRNGVRFQLDGQALSARFKGFAIDYYASQNSSAHKLTRQHKDFEMEDRLVSDDAIIENFLKYVTRIDILFVEENDETGYISRICELLPGKVHVYGNYQDFNHQTKNEITNSFVKEYGGVDDADFPETDNREEILSLIMSFTCFMQRYANSEFDMSNMLQNRGLTEYANEVRDNIKEYSLGVQSMDCKKLGDKVRNDLDDISFEPTTDGQKVLGIISRILKQMGYRDFFDFQEDVCGR